MVENLALACVSCSLRKGARRIATDPATGVETALFSPRSEAWEDHFEVSDDGWLVGRTATARATIELLKMNRPVAVALRREAARVKGSTER